MNRCTHCGTTEATRHSPGCPMRLTPPILIHTDGVELRRDKAGTIHIDDAPRRPTPLATFVLAGISGAFMAFVLFFILRWL